MDEGDAQVILNLSYRGFDVVTWLMLAASLAAGSSLVSVVGADSPPGRGPGRSVPALAGSSTWMFVGAVAFLWIAVGALTVAIVTLDTSLAYVAEQTRSEMPLALRISALWAGSEGSLLLFTAICGSVLIIGHRAAPRWQRTGVGLVIVGLVVALISGADPFERLDLPPLSGVGMAPILEHPAMVIHPPLLYLGMCLALAPGLVNDRRSARRFGLAAMAVLTVALGLGSVWAYVELGWGGWWAWDPIENVALVVWLLLAAAIHDRPAGRDDSPSARPLDATVIYAVCWPAVLGGAALTRTSLRTSVHAFADAAQLGIFLWPLVVVAGSGAAIRIVGHLRGATPSPGLWTGPSRAAIRRVPVVVLVTAAVIVAAGTYRPFVGGDGTAGWFYTRSLYPLAVVGAVLVGFVPLWRRPATGATSAMRWRHVGRGLPGRKTVGLAGATALSLAAGVSVVGWRAWYQVVLALAIGTGLGAVPAADRRAMARTAAHLGALAILWAAVAGTASTEAFVRLEPGETRSVAGHRVELISTEIVSDDPLQAVATVHVDGDRLTPSVAVFPERRLRLPEVATRTRPWLDVQVVLRDVDSDGQTLLMVLIRPWNQLVWWGIGLLSLGVVAAGVGTSTSGRVSPEAAAPSTTADSASRQGPGAAPVSTGVSPSQPSEPIGRDQQA